MQRNIRYHAIPIESGRKKNKNPATNVLSCVTFQVEDLWIFYNETEKK